MCDTQTGTLGPEFEEMAEEARLPRWVSAVLILALSGSLWALVLASLHVV